MSIEKLDEARTLLKMFDYADAIVYDESKGRYNGGECGWRCYKVLIGRFRRDKKPRRYPVNRPAGIQWDEGFRHTLAYHSPESLYEGVKRFIARHR